eukprot:3730491-Amphidinium_carterae.1
MATVSNKAKERTKLNEFHSNDRIDNLRNVASLAVGACPLVPERLSRSPVQAGSFALGNCPNAPRAAALGQCGHTESPT